MRRLNGTFKDKTLFHHAPHVLTTCGLSITPLILPRTRVFPTLPGRLDHCTLRHPSKFSFSELIQKLFRNKWIIYWERTTLLEKTERRATTPTQSCLFCITFFDCYGHGEKNAFFTQTTAQDKTKTRLLLHILLGGALKACMRESVWALWLPATHAA